MKVASALLSLPALTLVACVTNSNLCAPGSVYAPQYDACIGDDAGSSAPPDASAPAVADAVAPDPSDAGGDGSTGLGNTCNADSDCTGAASYCLKSPTAPTAAGYCTITHCTAAACTTAYSCCDCTAAAMSALAAWPPGICAPTSDEAQLTAFGCTCQ